jgi:spermidine/putrescine-binding protein
LILTILLFAPLTGCLGDYQISDECIIATDADGNTLTIITYDIIALSDEVLKEFTNQTGYEIKMIRADDFRRNLGEPTLDQRCSSSRSRPRVG